MWKDILFLLLSLFSLYEETKNSVFLSFSYVFIMLLKRTIEHFGIKLYLRINMGLVSKNEPWSTNHLYPDSGKYSMIALMDVHIAHGGQPSHVSQSLRSKIPSFNLSMRWMSVMLPSRVNARSKSLLLTNPCFNCHFKT